MKRPRKEHQLESSDELTEPSSEAQVPGDSGQPVGTETILVVENDEMLRDLARRTLTSAGYTVLMANDGQEALYLCESLDGHLALVLADVVMPLLGGRTFATRLRQVRPSTKILFMSGGSHRGLTDVLADSTVLLGKPFTATDLARKVRAVIDEVA
jgi:two-component system cell cycle sensor histidine kinase/response regulator CckA